MSVETYFYNGNNLDGLSDRVARLDCDKYIWRIRFDEYDEKTRLQEEKYHAMIGDVARQCMHLNQVLDAESWKRLLVQQFREDSIESGVDRVAEYWKRNEVKLMPSLSGKSLVLLGAQTRDFPKYVAAAFIEWLYAYGANNDIAWSKAEDFERWQERIAA